MGANSNVSRFDSVDEQRDPESFIKFVDRVNRIPMVLQLEEEATRELHLSPGDNVLDLGCGPGDDTCRLAEIVGPIGQALGIDASEQMVAVQTAMLGHLPYTVLRDAILTHPTMSEGLNEILATVPKESTRAG